MRLLLDSPYLDSIGFWAPKYMKRVKDMLRKCYEESLFLSDEELGEHINNRPDLWGSVPIREPKPGGWGLPGPAGFYPPPGMPAPLEFGSPQRGGGGGVGRKGIVERAEWPWRLGPEWPRPKDGKMGLSDLRGAPPWTVHPWDPHGRPGDIDIRPDQPGMQIPFDDYMRRKIIADGKAKEQRDLEEALEKAQKSPAQEMMEGAEYWYKFLFSPGAPLDLWKRGE